MRKDKQRLLDDRHDGPAILRDARDYALLNGLVLRCKHLASDNQVAHIPFTLFPSPFPKRLYVECLELQPIVNLLMTRIAHDHQLLEETLEPIGAVDEFTRNLLSLNRTVHREGLAQPIMSCINRADYMLDASSSSSKHLAIRQVEVNAIACGMPGDSDKIYSLHSFLRAKYGTIGHHHLPGNLTYPPDESLDLVARGLLNAFELYNNRQAHILLVAEERSYNFSDHFLIELRLHQMRPDVRFTRRRFVELADRCQLRLGPNKELLLDDSLEVAVVYFRHCYDPANFNYPDAWRVRLTLERSRAIKCPSISYHLSGAKKFQQVFDSQRKLERLLEPKDAQRLSAAICKFWPIDGQTPEGREGYRVGLSSHAHPNLVLKPTQREGGGHNIFRHDVQPFLKTIEHSPQRSQYILMDYINSPRHRNWLLLPEDHHEMDVSRLETSDRLITELGIFGSVLSSAGSGILVNEAAGYFVRSKKEDIDEGGISMGCAGITSLMLHDDDNDDDHLSHLYDM